MIDPRNLLRLNWMATMGINLRVGGLRGALRMPIKVYGKLKWEIRGEIVLPSDACRNTLIIGSRHEDYTASAGRAEISIRGRWVVDGIVRIGPDCFVGVAPGAVLRMGDGTCVGRDSQIHCEQHISIGRDVIMGETYMMDSDVHPIMKDSIKQPTRGRIIVGDGTYMGFRTMLLKDAVVPPHSVVASGAVCKKDYSLHADSSVLLAGVPATVKALNVRTCG